MGIKNYQIPSRPEEAMKDFERLMNGLTDVPAVADTVRAQALAVLEEDDDRTPNQARLQVLEFNEYISASADQVVGATSLADRATVDCEHFRPVHRTILKLVQELFTNPAFLQNFTRQNIKDGDLRVLIEQCIFDPRMVTDHLLDVFGLDEFKPYEADPKGRKWIYKYEQTNMRAAAIDTVKDFLTDGLEALEADGGSNLRVFRITKGKNKGKVVVTRNKRNGGKTLELTDLHSLGRRTDHINQNYTEKDVKVLGDIRQMIDDITSKIINDGWDAWRDRMEELEKKVSNALDGLSPNVLDKDKQIIRGKISLCITMEDRLDRVNPYSRLAILNSAKKFIARRLGRVSRISGYIAEDDMLALSHMYDDSAQIQSWYEDTASRYARPTRKPGVDMPLTLGNVGTARDALFCHREQLGSFKFQPYLGIAQKAIREIDKILATLDKRDLTQNDLNNSFKSTQEAFATVFAYAKLIEVERRVIEIRNRYFHPSQDLQSLAPNQVRGQISEILRVLNNKPVAPDVRLDKLTPAYSAVYALIGEMNQLAKDACATGSVDECVDLLKQIDALMKEFNVGDLLDELNQEF